MRREGAAAVENARNVRLTIGRMDQLITRLLDSVKLNSNGLEIVPRPLDAAALLREAVEIFRPLARVKSLALSLAVPSAPLRVTELGPSLWLMSRRIATGCFKCFRIF